ncbi:MAG: SIMPL domain-containing protein [bacterium]|nr:SIMPL domain-containing protein [bacterium]
MSVKKNEVKIQEKDCDKKKWSCRDAFKPFLYTFIILILMYFLVLLATMIRNNLREFYYIGKADRQERTITLEAVGKVITKPDIAVTSMGMTSEGKTVAEAQDKNTKVMNDLIAGLKALEIEEADIQTSNYNIYPQYDYLESEGRVLKGYTVSQNVEIKIRDLEKVNQVISLAGEVGANNVGGLNFTIDDMDVYLDEARVDAMKKIGEKAAVLRKSLGVQFVSIVSYNEYSGNGYPTPMYAMKSMDFGMGGGESAPSIESGSTEVNLNVNVVFEIN